METGLSQSTIQYLKTHTAEVLPRERLVSVILDEVYCAKKVEFVGGKLFGAQDDSITNTLLCFMVKTIAGSYRDMVAMVPIFKNQDQF